MALKLIQSIRKSIRMINHHVGVGGNKAHPSVNSFNSGFMTPDQKRTLENAGGQRITMPSGTDVFTLPAGRYEISNALNNPVGSDDYSFIEYDISTSFDGRRQIEAYLSSTGRRYYRSIHTGGGTDTGSRMWDYDPFIIWEGSVSSGTLHYFVPMNAFKNGIRIVYSTISNQKGSFNLYGTTSGNAALNVGNNTSDASTFQSYELNISFDLTSITINNNTMTTISSAGVAAGDSNLTTITRVYAI